MAFETPCQTPGARYATHISPYLVSIDVRWEQRVDLGDTTALEKNLHNAVEMVLAPHFMVVEAPRGSSDLPAGEGEPGQSAPSEKQLEDLESRLRVAVEALREIASYEYSLAGVLRAPEIAIKALASLSRRDQP